MVKGRWVYFTPDICSADWAVVGQTFLEMTKEMPGTSLRIVTEGGSCVVAREVVCQFSRGLAVGAAGSMEASLCC